MTAADLSSSHSQPDPADPRLPDSSPSSSRASSSLIDNQAESMELVPRDVSPPPPDERAQNLRDERRYRMRLLQHAYELYPACECFPSSPKFVVLTLSSDAPALEPVDEPRH